MACSGASPPMETAALTVSPGNLGIQRGFLSEHSYGGFHVYAWSRVVRIACSIDSRGWTSDRRSGWPDARAAEARGNSGRDRARPEQAAQFGPDSLGRWLCPGREAKPLFVEVGAAGDRSHRAIMCPAGPVRLRL